MNLVRDPRWGRAQETYGEDPHLMSKLVVELVTGAQNNSVGNVVGPDGLRVGACCKHFAAYDIENMPVTRYEFNANVTSRDFWETYMPGGAVMQEYSHITGHVGCCVLCFETIILEHQFTATSLVYCYASQHSMPASWKPKHRM